jgi:hypothetical protein
MRTLVTVLSLLALAGCEDRAKMCWAIAETPDAARQPKDRIYWNEKCGELREQLAKKQSAAALTEFLDRIGGPDRRTPVHPAGKTTFAGPAKDKSECVEAFDEATSQCESWDDYWTKKRAAEAAVKKTAEAPANKKKGARP